MAEDEMIGHQPLGGHEFQQTPGDGESQGSLMCCSPWGCKVLDKVKVTQCLTLCDPMEKSMEFCRPEYWSE